MGHQPCHGNRDMDAETAKPSSSSPASKVLDDDDLLGEILHRVDSPATLVRAALATKRWLRVASGRAFLRRFRKRHPPRLHGFYVTGDGVPRPEFIRPDAGHVDGARRRPPPRRRLRVRLLPGVLVRSPGQPQRPRPLQILHPVGYPLALSDMMRRPGTAMAELPSPPPPTLPGRPLDAALLPDDDVLPRGRSPRAPDGPSPPRSPSSFAPAAPGPTSAPRRPSSPWRR
ncbi:hypothetical protein PR202_gb06938 [Eleusine coracana subsp. coracana]|uniref:F-box domain-containing protein n=1 Tax=Eleusine coracana subsp. coracana TaxID=191504 RepID=A0AAV5EBC5_ELECO|nr:hypothetical protein PR202_gb06938 [Eleusine coracana subsp. coracana]